MIIIIDMANQGLNFNQLWKNIIENIDNSNEQKLTQIEHNYLFIIGNYMLKY